METSENFAFVGERFPFFKESATRAELQAYADPRASCFHARHALERLVIRLFKVDKSLNQPTVNNLDAYMTEPSFLSLVPQIVWEKAELVRKAGNSAVHGKKAPKPETAIDVLRQLFDVAYWVGRTYVEDGANKLAGRTYDESLVPRVELSANPASLQDLDALKAQLDAAEAANQEKQEEIDRLREELAGFKQQNEVVPETRDWSEAKTRKMIIDVELRLAGWELDHEDDIEYEVTGMPTASGIGYVDYVLWGENGKPLALVEAKKTTVDPEVGKQQAKLYADCLEGMHDQRPIIFYTNGFRTEMWDDRFYPPRTVAGFYRREELERLIQRRARRLSLLDEPINEEISGRPYQERAIRSIGETFESSHRKCLLVMATGTGKTRTAIALVDLLQRANWAKRTLFLADRISLVNQAVGAFKSHLPDSSPVNLITEKEAEGRVYASTYPTMLSLINQRDREGKGRFGPGYFDLVIIDEAHRSVYQKYGAIFEYFDSLLVGLTATPRDDIDRNTYELFRLEQGVPTDVYELDEAVREGFLVPAKQLSVPLKYQREGIKYDDLSEEDKERWEELDWQEDEEGGTPDEVKAGSVNRWLFNEDTVDKVLQFVMEKGLKTDMGDRLGKTIVFARNHNHAMFIEERFNANYPEHRGHFARVIDNYAKFPGSLIEDFSDKEHDLRMAISVDMLDTGIDVPEVVNLVFFKPIHSRIKFLQMMGRGTRLCPDLFGPGMDKEYFLVLDFCENLKFFAENPEGAGASAAEPLPKRLFKARLELLQGLGKQEGGEREASGDLRTALAKTLGDEVRGMNLDNFIVKLKRETVGRFQEAGKDWEKLSSADYAELEREVAGLPSQVEMDEVEARLFDLKILRLQLCLVEGNGASFDKLRQGVMEVAGQLSEMPEVPQVAAILSFLGELQEDDWWTDATPAMLENVRKKLRGLVRLIEKAKQAVIYTNFEDEIGEAELVEEPRAAYGGINLARFRQKTTEFLRARENDLVIHKLRHREALTQMDLEELQNVLIEQGGEKGEDLLNQLLSEQGQNVAEFARSIVGLDRKAASEPFARFLDQANFNARQIRFVEMIVDFVTRNGKLEAKQLYDTPFTDDGLVESIFPDEQDADAIFELVKEVSRVRFG